MKFADVKKGTRAEIEVPVPNTLTGDGAQAFALTRPMHEDEEVVVLAAALAEASSNGVIDPKRGVELYDEAVMVHTIAVAYLDPDSPVEKRECFFESAEQIRKNFSADEIAYMWERQEVHQNSCSPSLRKYSVSEMFDLAKKMAEAKDDGPFVALAPATRCSLLRFLAAQWLNSQDSKSQSGLSSQEHAKS